MAEKPVLVTVNAGRLRSDAEGFSRLARLHGELKNFHNSTIRVDMSRVSQVDGHLAAAFLIVVRRAETAGNSILFHQTQPSVVTVLRRSGLLQNRIEDRTQTAMPLQEFSLLHAVEFSQYARKYLARREMPHMSAALQNKFFEGIDELFANSALHSKASIPVVACGQFYRSSGMLDFAIVDGGRSIPGSLKESGILKRSDADAIDWAMVPGNTTRQGDIPGGLGSKVLREFIELNGGSLQIVSGRGLWMQSQKGVHKESLSHPFPGTIVNLEINTSDNNLYDLVDGPDPKNIW